MKAIGKNSSRPPYPFLLSEKKKKKKAFEKIMERLMLQAGNWEINSYVNYFPAVSYWLHCSLISIQGIIVKDLEPLEPFSAI